MIICCICAHVNKLTGKPYKGEFECGFCKSPGVNAAYEVESLTLEQQARASRAYAEFTGQSLSLAESSHWGTMKVEKPS